MRGWSVRRDMLSCLAMSAQWMFVWCGARSHQCWTAARFCPFPACISLSITQEHLNCPVFQLAVGRFLQQCRWRVDVVACWRQKTQSRGKVLLQYYSVLQSTTPVLLRTTEYQSRTILIPNEAWKHFDLSSQHKKTTTFIMVLYRSWNFWHLHLPHHLLAMSEAAFGLRNGNNQSVLYLSKMRSVFTLAIRRTRTATFNPESFPFNPKNRLPSSLVNYREIFTIDALY